MAESDLAEVTAIEADSFPQPWSKTHFLDELASSLSFPLVAIDQAGTVLGYICPICILDEGHILDIAVRKESRGQKVGQLLVEKVIAESRDRGAAFVSLEVRPSNGAAIALYHRLSFVETGRRKKYYENGEDALLMEYVYEKQVEG
jgi:ribosomal-protein-alanine N-acetyltransferase